MTLRFQHRRTLGDVAHLAAIATAFQLHRLPPALSFIPRAASRPRGRTHPTGAREVTPLYGPPTDPSPAGAARGLATGGSTLPAIPAAPRRAGMLLNPPTILAACRPSPPFRPARSS